MVHCTIHLLSLQPGYAKNEIASRFAHTDGQHGPKVLIAGVPHGWIHKAHNHDVDLLLGHEWHLFILTNSASEAPQLGEGMLAHLAIDITVPEDQWKQLVQDNLSTPAAWHSAPQLPADWTEARTGELQIPMHQRADQSMERPDAGTLQLDEPMAKLLSEALPRGVRQQPVSLFNLFKYRDGDSSVHDQYMRDFAENFGDSAGARVKFMGPVRSRVTECGQSDGQRSENLWQDANLVHYDSIYHYAYMLSTEVYQKLNKDKVRGLEDTCIMVVSEVEMSYGA